MCKIKKAVALPFLLPNGPQNEFPLPITLSSMYLMRLATSSIPRESFPHLEGRSSCMDSDLPFVPLDFFRTLVIIVTLHNGTHYNCHTVLFTFCVSGALCVGRIRVER